MIKIEVANMQDALKVKASNIKKMLKSVLKKENVKNAEISVALVDNKKIVELNKKYLNKGQGTDVLSFLLDTNFDGQGTILGDIITSCEMAKESARRLKITAQAEVMNYIIHGLLHILGYDDDTSKKRHKMHNFQRAILEDFGYHLEK